MMTFCENFWQLFDLYCRLQDDEKLDPKAIVRAKAAVEKHKHECRECARLNPNVPLAPE